MVFVDQIAANKRLSAISSVGESFPMHSSANGKAALALLSDAEIEKICKKTGLVKETSHTITSRSLLMEAIEETRETHIAIDAEEHTEGICALGAAFHDPIGRIFAVSVPVPSIRFAKLRDAISGALIDLRKRLLFSLNK